MAEFIEPKKRPEKIRRQLQQLSLHTSNQFEPLFNLKEDTEVSRCRRVDSRYKVSSNNTVKNDKRKIVIIGDSHARNCAAGLHHQLGRKFSVSGYVKPRAGMKVIVQSGKEETEKLNREDVVVVWGFQMTLVDRIPRKR